MRKLCLLFLVFALTRGARGYSVLTHEAIIDSAWNDNIVPLLCKRFPNASAEDLRKAHAYAYGGAIIQDMGYYPFGSRLFSDMVHYVRSGDFVVNLIRDSQDLDEYGFALGALAHYVSDNNGHPLAVNRAVPIEYPKLEARYGNNVPYGLDPAAHLKVEFGFDVLEVASGHYASKAYHDFIGFEVSKRVLECAFLDTYGLKLEDVFASIDLALGTYRRSVSSVIPEATKVAWNLKKDELVKAEPGLTKRKFVYNLSRSSYEREWGHEFERPGVGARILSFLFRIIPKVGPFRGVSFKPPTEQTATMFMSSFNVTLDGYRALLRDVGARGLRLENKDFDTGQPTREGEYRLADETYAELVRKLADKKFACVTPAIRSNILAFFSDPEAPNYARRKKDEWQKTMQALADLRALGAAPAAGSSEAAALPSRQE